MKPFLILLAAFTLTASTNAQGYVSFDNLFVDAPIYMPDGTGPGAAGRAQLYLLTEAGYSPVGPIQGFLTITPEAAYFINGAPVPIPGLPAPSPATLQIRAWVNAPNWESAVIRGESNDVTVNLRVELGAILDGLQSFTLVPEPSILTLGILAAGTLLLTHPKQKAQP